jgi:AcrR family transcriptional regulator
VEKKGMPRFISPEGQEDHRTKVARKRRERTRAHLLAAVLAVYPGDSASAPAVIDDVIRAANVSRGTFYKYFPSLEEAVSELGNKLGDELAQAYATILNGFPKPIDRMALGIQICLFQAMIEPRWGEFVAHMNHTGKKNNPALEGMIDNLSQGLAAGEFTFDTIDAAVDLAMGCMIESIRRLIAGGKSSAYIEQITSMLLRGLGAPPAAAKRAASDANRHLRDKGESAFEWWPSMPDSENVARPRPAAARYGVEGARSQEVVSPRRRVT